MLIRRENANLAPVVQEYESYTSASLASGDTYDNAIISEIAVENAKSVLLQSDFQRHSGGGGHVFLALPIAARNSKGVVRVLDFGGAAGLHAALSIKTLTDVDQRWAIVETPSMVRACSGLSTENVQFFEAIEDALSWLGEADLVHSSGALQYMPDAIASVNELLSIKAQLLLIQKSALSLGREIVELESISLGGHRSGRFSQAHHDHVAKIPVTYVNQDDFITSLCNGYDIAFAFSGHPLKIINDTEIEFGSADLLQRN